VAGENLMRARELKQARARLKMSQRELAEALDLQRETVARYEISKLPVPKVVAMAVAWLEYQARGTRKTA